MDKVIVVGVCIKNDNNEILMVQEAEEKFFGLYNFPAGKLDNGESIFDGAIREAKEETGYDVNLDSILCIQYLENRNILKIIFNATIVSGNESFDKSEIMDIKWFSFEELEKLSNEELRSYESNINIIKCAKESNNYSLDIIKNIC